MNMTAKLQNDNNFDSYFLKDAMFVCTGPEQMNHDLIGISLC